MNCFMAVPAACIEISDGWMSLVERMVCKYALAYERSYVNPSATFVRFLPVLGSTHVMYTLPLR